MQKFSVCIAFISLLCGFSVADECFENCTEYRPESPLVYCDHLPLEFLNCSEPEDRKENETVDPDTGKKFGCTKWGGEKYQDVELTQVWCQPLEGVECYSQNGKKRFLKDGFPCIKGEVKRIRDKYTGHYFVTTLIYSVLLGFLGMDRFCLGHTGTAVGKLLTLGGVGIWWIVDIVLLVTGVLRPVDNSNWEPYY